MENLKSLRKKIDRIDAAIIKKLSARQQISEKIGRLKIALGKPVKDFPREAAQKQQYAQLCLNYQVDFALVNRLFKLIISHSRNLQKNGR